VQQTNSDVINRFRGIGFLLVVCGCFSSACTVKKLFDIFVCALKFSCKFAFETNFCKFDPCNDPVPQFLLLHIVYLAEMRIFSCQALWYVSPVSRYARKRLSWNFSSTSPKRGVLGITPLRDETYHRDPRKEHPWPKLRRLMHNMWDSSARGRLWACPTTQLTFERYNYVDVTFIFYWYNVNWWYVDSPAVCSFFSVRITLVQVT
jgi:hypothetical protein